MRWRLRTLGIKPAEAQERRFQITPRSEAVVDFNRPGNYGIFWWDGRTETVKFLKDLADIAGKKGERKAEALLPLDRTSSTVRLLILFDGEKEGAPVAITVPSP